MQKNILNPIADIVKKVKSLENTLVSFLNRNENDKIKTSKIITNAEYMEVFE